MKIINPYQGIDFSTTPRVLANSHEHLNINGANPEMNSIKKSWDRGIRWFASVNYNPAAPAYPYNSWSSPYKTYNNIPDDYTLVDAVYNGGWESFVDKDGNTVNAVDLPAVPNNEHPKFAINKNASPIYFNQHFNVLGTLWGEAGHGSGIVYEKIESHPIWETADIPNVFTQESAAFNGKLFGTINHCNSYNAATRLLKVAPSLFKGFEIYNHDSTYSDNVEFREMYDILLKEGYRLYPLAVVDWQGTGHDNPTKCDCGCNVLYIPDYNSYNVAQKSEAGLDSYISGKYYASGFGYQKIDTLNINGNSVTFAVSGTPAIIKAVTSKRVLEFANTNTIVVNIQPNESYVRFEAWYNDAPEGFDEMSAEEQMPYCLKGSKDFIVTSPLWIEDNNNSFIQDAYILGII